MDRQKIICKKERKKNNVKDYTENAAMTAEFSDCSRP